MRADAAGRPHERRPPGERRRTVLDRWKRLALLLVMFGLWGCAAVGPDYVRPDSTLPAHWRGAHSDGPVSDAPAAESLARWWESLSDPVLADLIQQAVAGSLDLKQAAARVRAARALAGKAAAERWPAATVSGGHTHTDEIRGTGASDLFAAGFDASWEIDLFGAVRRSLEAAEADLAAETEALRDVRISLVAEVARNYVAVRTLQARLEAAEANRTIQQQTFQLTRYREMAGLEDKLALARARSNLETTRANIPALEAERETAGNRIAVLVGKAPGAVHPIWKAGAPIPVPPASVAVGIPADLLRRRPDVRQAEQALAAQTARIGEAEADLYPRLTLSGTLDLEAGSAGSLFDRDNGSVSFGPRLSWPLFDAGRIRRNIAVQDARADEARLQYQAAVLAALEETENALSDLVREQARQEALQAAAAAAGEAEALARHRYAAGLIDFGELLDAQRSRLDAQDALAQSRGRAALDLITLYKSLGGGWGPPPAPRAAVSSPAAGAKEPI